MDARSHYQERLMQCQQKISELQQRLSYFVWLRLATFLPALLLLIAGYTTSAGMPAVLIGWGLAAAFLVTITFQDALERKWEGQKAFHKLYRRLIARMDRDWNGIPDLPCPDGVQLDSHQRACCDDLDIFGSRSLFAWMCLAATKLGQRTLAVWLVDLASVSLMIRRQEAARELVGDRQRREQFLWHSSQISDSSADPDKFVQWAESTDWLSLHRTIHRLSWLGPFLILLGVGTWWFSQLNDLLTGGWIGIALLATGAGINLFIASTQLGNIHDTFSRIASHHGEVQHYRELFDCMAAMPRQSHLLNEIYARCFDGTNTAQAGLDQLQRVVRLANVQRSPLWMIPYVVAQLLFLWDFRVMERLTRWQHIYGLQVRGWMTALGECEAILSIATICDEYPDWSFPKWLEDGTKPLEAKDLAHPLLPDLKRVGNDITIEANRPILVVTGSNMAGKSTLLRAIGVNLLLARTGSVVCARELTTRPFQLATSIRVQDNLQDGVSFFFAELLRLKEIIEQSAQQFRLSKTPVLALLDEILQGTNSRERQIAVIEVIEQLDRLGVITLISTHDLELADRKEMMDRSQVVHFREYLEVVKGTEQMRFDYKMRPGPTPTTNALKLLEIVGIRATSEDRN